MSAPRNWVQIKKKREPVTGTLHMATLRCNVEGKSAKGDGKWATSEIGRKLGELGIQEAKCRHGLKEKGVIVFFTCHQ